MKVCLFTLSGVVVAVQRSFGPSTDVKTYLLTYLGSHLLAVVCCRGVIPVSQMDDVHQYTPPESVRHAVHDAALQSRSMKVIQRSLMTE